MLIARFYISALALFILTCMNSVAIADTAQEIVLTSADNFSVMASIRGHANYEPPFLKVTFDDAVLRGNPKFDRVSRLNGYRLGIAFHADHPGWDTKRWSSLQRLNGDIAPDQTVDLGNPVLRIPIDGLSLQGGWLVLEVDVQNAQGQYGTTYAHSQPLRFP